MLPPFVAWKTFPVVLGGSSSSSYGHPKESWVAPWGKRPLSLPRSRYSISFIALVMRRVNCATMGDSGGLSACISRISLPVGRALPAIMGKDQNEGVFPRCSHPDYGGKQKAKKAGRKEHHLWMKRDSTGSGQKALNLARIVSKLPNEKGAIYEALDRWCAFETEFPLVAIAKALRILRKRRQWLNIIQVTKWLLNKGQGMTMGTYDALLLAFDMEGRIPEAEALWGTILHRHARSVSKQLFSRMISLYSHHCMPDKVLEVFADMEELGVKPDGDTAKRVGTAFQNLGQVDNQKRLLEKYESKFRFLHFNGERVKVRNSEVCKE